MVFTFSGESARCQAIAILNWNAPINSFGNDMCRVKKVRMPADRAAPGTFATLLTIDSPFATCFVIPACMSYTISAVSCGRMISFNDCGILIPRYSCIPYLFLQIPEYFHCNIRVPMKNSTERRRLCAIQLNARSTRKAPGFRTSHTTQGRCALGCGDAHQNQKGGF